MAKFRDLANEAKKNWTAFDRAVYERALEVFKARKDAHEEARMRREDAEAVRRELGETRHLRRSAAKAMWEKALKDEPPAGDTPPITPSMINRQSAARMSGEGGA